MNKCFLLLFIAIFPLSGEDKFINPLTDICWECFFPMTIIGFEVTPSQNNGFIDFSNPTNLVPVSTKFDWSKFYCYCHGKPPRPGIPISFWEPTKLIDVTKEAYKLVGLGGVKIGKADLKNRGAVKRRKSGNKSSFSHVHVYEYPIFAIMEVFTDFACIESGSLDTAYFSELDYTWYDDSLSNILNPEVSLFANPLAQAACVADCASSTLNNPLDKLFWCGGCHGSIYPMTGTVGDHIGPIQEALLITQRVLAKMHRSSMIKGYEKGNYCEKSWMPIWQKSLYKIQIASPIPKTSGECPPLGGSEVVWGAGKSYPGPGEEFSFILWSKKQCCLDVVKIATKAYGSEMTGIE